jgi:deoxyribose-phosphate aldolase
LPLAAALLKGSGCGVCTVVGFPLGALTALTKTVETRDAVANGADEIDMVINIGALKAGDRRQVLAELRSVREAARGKILKVILETAYLSRREIVAACRLAREAGADFVKTSTGFGPAGATEENVALMRRSVGRSMGVKAAGGIRSAQTALAMVAAGADRVGSSRSVAIVREAAQVRRNRRSR